MTNEEAINQLCQQEKLRGKGIPYQVDNLVIATAISALEKQISKKVNISLKGTTDWNTKCHCPNCHSMVLHGKYCSTCGQALDWSDGK